MERTPLCVNELDYLRWVKKARIQILNATDRQAIDSQMTGAIVKREDGLLAEPPAALDL